MTRILIHDISRLAGLQFDLYNYESPLKLSDSLLLFASIVTKLVHEARGIEEYLVLTN